MHRVHQSRDALCGFLRHTEDEWAKIPHCSHRHAKWNHLTSVQLNWTEQQSRNGLNTIFQLASIVHLYCYVWVDIHTHAQTHTPPLSVTWTSLHQRDLILPRFLLFRGRKQHWQSDRMVWNGEWQMCFQLSTEAMIYVMKGRSFPFSLLGDSGFMLKDATQIGDASCAFLELPAQIVSSGFPREFKMKWQACCSCRDIDWPISSCQFLDYSDY